MFSPPVMCWVFFFYFFYHYIVCRYSSYSFWLPLWHIQYFLGECHSYLHLKENICLWEIGDWECKLKFSNPTHYILMLVFIFCLGVLCCVFFFFFCLFSVLFFVCLFVCFYIFCFLLIFVLCVACPMLPITLVCQFKIPLSIFSNVYFLWQSIFSSHIHPSKCHILNKKLWLKPEELVAWNYHLLLYYFLFT